MSVYVAQPAEPGGPANPPCANCGAAFRLHKIPPSETGLRTPIAGDRLRLTTQGLAKLASFGVDLVCPVAARPGSLVTALGQLAGAVQRGDPALVFAARGEVQRLMGHRPQGVGHCTCCTALADTQP